jgi:hypothetical protein
MCGNDYEIVKWRLECIRIKNTLLIDPKMLWISII